jgi:hypothetical protein
LSANKFIVNTEGGEALFRAAVKRKDTGAFPAFQKNAVLGEKGFGLKTFYDLFLKVRRYGLYVNEIIKVDDIVKLKVFAA